MRGWGQKKFESNPNKNNSNNQERKIIQINNMIVGNDIMTKDITAE